MVSLDSLALEQALFDLDRLALMWAARKERRRFMEECEASFLPALAFDDVHDTLLDFDDVPDTLPEDVR